MAAMTNFLELEVLDHVLGTAAYTAPTNVYVKLHIGAPGEDATGNPAAETTRKVAAFNVAAAGQATLNGTLSWTSVAGTETYSHWSLWDTVGPAGGNPLLQGALDSTVSVNAGDNFDLTALTISAD